MVRTALFAGMMTLWASAAERSGRATVEWISASATCEPGKSLQTAIRMTLDDGWHTYWLNPGEGGMKISVEWQLPAAWSAGGLLHPVPRRFTAGGLAGFGYKGIVVFPVTVTPPPDFEGEVKLRGKISWLTCDEESCIPGDAEVSLDLKSGSFSPGSEAATIRTALHKVPRAPDERVRLDVTEKPGSLVLGIASPPDLSHDWSSYEVFPATPQVFDPAAGFRFSKSATSWIAEVPKCQYAKIPVRQLTLILASKDDGDSFELSWNAP